MNHNGYEAPNTVQVPLALFKMLPEITTGSELKVILVIMERELAYGAPDVAITFTELEQLTGMTRQAVCNGIDAALTNKHITREKHGNSFSYRLKLSVYSIDRNGMKSRLTTTTNIPDGISGEEKARPDIYQVWMSETGILIGSSIKNGLDVLEEMYGYDDLVDAISEAVVTKGPRQFSTKYVEAILRNWKTNGRNAKKPVEDINPYAHRTVIR